MTHLFIYLILLMLAWLGFLWVFGGGVVCLCFVFLGLFFVVVGFSLFVFFNY